MRDQRHSALKLLLVLAAGSMLSPVSAQLDYEQDPINYSTADATDPVARLSEKLRTGEAKLAWDEQHGYLRSVLEQLNVPVTSQTLVFSRTSLQISRISPSTPRAIYFNDDVYVGWVQRGDLVEISAADPVLGGTFYTLPQRKTDFPEIARETAHCLQCHGSSHTRRSPGHMVRSVYSDAGGRPVYRLGTHLTDDTSPFEERWGGWYVTGTHGKQRHMGNVLLRDEKESEQLDMEAGANITDLSPLVNTAPYLSSHSDIVALMVLQHQTTVHNIITAAGHSGRLTARDSEIMNRALERDPDFESESTARRYASAAERIVQSLFFCGAQPLTDTVSGTSGFTEEFAARGPFDSRGRSLRQFDLQSRLFRYPCSFLIYSDSFAALPEGVRKLVWQRIHQILNGQDDSPQFAHLTAADRKAIREILQDTLDPDCQQSHDVPLVENRSESESGVSDR